MGEKAIRRYIDIGLELAAKWRQRDPEAVLMYFAAVSRVCAGGSSDD